MTTQDYLEQLQQDKADLVDNLTEKGIEGLTGDETFTELVPEVLNIPSGGGGGRYKPKAMTTFNFSNSPNQAYIQEDVDNIDVENFTLLSSTFTNCRNLQSLDLKKWNPINVTNMTSTFSNCVGLTIIDISNWVTPVVENMSSMFHTCSALSNLKTNTSNIIHAYNYASMFENCSSLV